MSEADQIGRLLAPLRDDPIHSGLFTDFDGTLAEIVDDPAVAGPVVGAVEVLTKLAPKFGRVWVVSGRPVSFLESRLPSGVNLSGLYGLESSVDGVRSEHPGAARWREVIERVYDDARRVLTLVNAENKGLALTLHYRGHEKVEAEVRSYADDQARRTGLVVHGARMSVELRPPVEADKGTVVEAAADGLDTVCFIGDDRGDLTAFDALDRLARRSIATVRVGVYSVEAPAELLDRADLVVDGPRGVVSLLKTFTE